MTAVAAAELEHDVVALVSPEVGNPLQRKMYKLIVHQQFRESVEC